MKVSGTGQNVLTVVVPARRDKQAESLQRQSSEDSLKLQWVRALCSPNKVSCDLCVRSQDTKQGNDTRVTNRVQSPHL